MFQETTDNNTNIHKIRVYCTNLSYKRRNIA